jgi:hypothetical protein
MVGMRRSGSQRGEAIACFEVLYPYEVRQELQAALREIPFVSNKLSRASLVEPVACLHTPLGVETASAQEAV